MSPPRPTTGSWADTRACCPVSSRISPRLMRDSGRSTSAVAPGRSRASSSPAWARARWRRSIHRRRSSPPPGSGTRESTSARRLPSTSRSRPATFDTTLAQLVVHFMADPVRGADRDAARDTAGRHARGLRLGPRRSPGPLRLFWDAARSLDPGLDDESQLPGTREGHLVELFRSAGLRGATGTALEIRVEHPTFDEWWDPFTRGVGPAGAYLGRQDPARQAAIREAALRRAGPRADRDRRRRVGGARAA